MNDNTAISFDAHFDRTLVRADGRSVRYLVVDVEARRGWTIVRSCIL